MNADERRLKTKKVIRVDQRSSAAEIEFFSILLESRWAALTVQPAIFAILKLHARGIVPLLRRESARAHGPAVYLRAAGDAAAPRAGGLPASGAVWDAEDDGRDLAVPRRFAGYGHARSAAVDRRGPGAGFRIARPGTMDRRLLLRPAGRCVARDAAARGRDAARQDLVPD